MTAPAAAEGSADVAIIGAGIVGLATARELLARAPELAVVVLDQEDRVGAHQTSHNSGVIHSGLYYKPGSAKARTCVGGARRMLAFCQEQALPCRTVGKVVVATDPSEVPRLDELERRGRANGVPGLARLSPEALREREPHVRGVAALHVPSAAIVDYGLVAQRLASLVNAAGGRVVLRSAVRTIRADADVHVLTTDSGELRARFLITCAGLWSDRVTALEAGERPARIVPFRGEYYTLVAERESLVQGLVYPVPDPRFPFLGVHFTRMVHGGVEAGPNAVLAFARDGYRKTSFRLGDALDTLRYPAFWKLAGRYWRTGAGEVWRSLSKAAFTRALRKLVPELRAEDLRPGGSGVRAQALLPDGTLCDDFLIVERPRALHVCNAPSPAATASLAIAAEIVERSGLARRATAAGTA
jgi:L-2-hydroxyglutarate oxidase LhgO